MASRNRWLVTIVVLAGVGALLSWHPGHRIDTGNPAQATRSAQQSGLAIEHAVPGLVPPRLSHAVTTGANQPAAIHPHALPPDNAALTQTYDTLARLAGNGDAAAIKRLARDLSLCRSYAALRKQALQLDKAYAELPDTLTVEQTRSVKAMLDNDARIEKLLQERQPLCDGVGPRQLDHAFEWLMRAAALGDTDAADCWIGHPPMDVEHPLQHIDRLQQYRENAIAIAERAVEAGDWQMVSLLQDVYSGDSRFLMSQFVPSNPVKAYGYLRLQRFAAADGYADKLDDEMAAVVTGLTPEQKLEMDAWAKDTYRRFLSANVPANYDGSFNACQ